ncbi:hypothetical protein [Ligilactobacillus equi]|nr:hypothetical protein [Ligilactobacillus equi]
MNFNFGEEKNKLEELIKLLAETKKLSEQLKQKLIDLENFKF